MLTFRIVIMVTTIPSTTITSSPMKNAYKHSQSTSTQPAMLKLVHCCSIFLWDLDWKYSARWEPSIWRCRLLSALQRAEMTDLDQIFCMRYFLCIWRAPSKIFVHFFLLWPPQKGRSFRSGCFSKIAARAAFLSCLFCSICGPVSVFGRWVIWHQDRYNGNSVPPMQWILIYD